jgi:hydroxymethylpyrimidine/phosphomethylpyrimidine kinase
VLPDRLFWAQAEEDDTEEDDGPADPSDFALPPHDTRH